MDNEYNRETFFPLRLVEEVIFILKEKNCLFIRYEDFKLNLIHPKLDKLSYILEFIDFNLGHYNRFVQTTLLARFLYNKVVFRQKLFDFLTQLNTRNGPVVVLQHDADQQPNKTIDLMKFEEQLGVVSSSYFFKEQNFDTQKKYILDIDELKTLEGKGFEIGYHLNGYELADYDEKKAWDIIAADLAYFAREFNLKTFVPHGGHPSTSGINNDNIPYKGPLRKYSWCYNGRGFVQNESWSDGNIYFENLEDPRVVASRLRKGQRARFLMHPQYYGTELSARYTELPVSKNEWWTGLWNI